MSSLGQSLLLAPQAVGDLPYLPQSLLVRLGRQLIRMQADGAELGRRPSSAKMIRAVFKAQAGSFVLPPAVSSTTPVFALSGAKNPCTRPAYRAWNRLHRASRLPVSVEKYRGEANTITSAPSTSW